MENQMKKILILSLSLLISTQLFSKTSTQNKQDVHSKHPLKRITLNHGKKWNVDQIMIENMNTIIEENKKIVFLEKQNKATKKDYNKLSNHILTSTKIIVTKCKLEPKADEIYHTVLADLNIVAENLKDTKKSKQAVEKLQTTLQTYIKLFTHPTSK